ncbi:MAG: hypothetical protein AAGE94_23400 [Acidobacteriota bacterium]
MASATFAAALVAGMLGGSAADATPLSSRLPVEVERVLEPQAADLVLRGPELIPQCPRARLRPAGKPIRGAIERQRRGVVRYVPAPTFWSVGGDTMTLRVRACPQIRRLLLRIEAGAVTQDAEAVGFGAGSPPWKLDDPERRIQLPVATFADAPFGLTIRPGQAPATIDIVPPTTADDGQANGGSVIVQVDVDDDADPIEPPDPDTIVPVVLWRALGFGAAPVAELAIDGDRLRLAVDGDSGRRTSCSARFSGHRGDVAIDWWHDELDGGARLMIDGVYGCSIDGVTNIDRRAVTHRLGDVDGTAVFPIALDAPIVARGLPAARRTLRVRSDFADPESWTLQPANGWTVDRRRFGSAWATVDAGTVFVAPWAAPATRPWTVEWAFDPASSTAPEPFTVWRATDDRGTEHLALQLRREIAGDAVRLVGRDATGTTIASGWQPIQPGALRLAIQARPGPDGDLARLWIGDEPAVELAGIALGTPTAQEIGSPVAAGRLELGLLSLWSDRR